MELTRSNLTRPDTTPHPDRTRQKKKRLGCHYFKPNADQVIDWIRVYRVEPKFNFGQIWLKLTRDGMKPFAVLYIQNVRIKACRPIIFSMGPKKKKKAFELHNIQF